MESNGTETAVTPKSHMVIPPFLRQADSSGGCNTRFFYRLKSRRCAMPNIYGAMTDDRKARIWQLWQQGHPMSDLSRTIEKLAARVYSYLLYHGGIAPRPTFRRAVCLTFEEREMISRTLSPEQIAGWLKSEQRGTCKEMCVSHETIYKSLFIQM